MSSYPSHLESLLRNSLFAKAPVLEVGIFLVVLISYRRRKVNHDRSIIILSFFNLSDSSDKLLPTLILSGEWTYPEYFM